MASYRVILAPTVAAMGMRLLRLAPSFLAVVVPLLLTGLSPAGLHPAAGTMATRASGTTGGRGNSYFTTGTSLAAPRARS